MVVSGRGSVDGSRQMAIRVVDHRKHPTRIVSRLATQLVLLVALLFTVMFVFELGARLYLVHFAPLKQFLFYASFNQLKGQGYTDPRYTPHRYLSYYPTPGYETAKDRHNQLGFRGEEISQPKPAHEYRIVCLGGSTTYTSEVEDYRQSYPAQLERQLVSRGHEYVKVINGGAAFYSSWESLINLQFRVLGLEPDMVIIYHGINDIRARLVWPHESYRADNSGFRAPNHSRIFMPSILEHSTLIRAIMLKMGLIESHAALSRILDKHAATSYSDDFEMQKIKKQYPADVFEDASFEVILRRNPPDHFERNITNMILVCNHWGIEPVIATFACSSNYLDSVDSLEEWLPALAETNEVIRTVASRTGAHLFDFEAVFSQAPQYYVDESHVNEAGAQRKAELFADYLISNGLLSRRSPVATTADTASQSQ